MNLVKQQIANTATAYHHLLFNKKLPSLINVASLKTLPEVPKEKSID